MRSYIITSGAIFGLLVVAHLARLAVEPHVARDPVYVLLTIAAAALSVWAFRVLRLVPRR